jgi:hypothetical protein
MVDVLSSFEGTANVHCYTSCTLTPLHCSKVVISSVLSHEKINSNIYKNVRGVLTFVIYCIVSAGLATRLSAKVLDPSLDTWVISMALLICIVRLQ